MTCAKDNAKPMLRPIKARPMLRPMHRPMLARLKLARPMLGLFIGLR